MLDYTQTFPKLSFGLKWGRLLIASVLKFLFTFVSVLAETGMLVR